MKDSQKKLLKICYAAMFAALICVATLVIQIPSPLGGFINFADCFILIAAWGLGPVYGFAAGGIGSALADIISGYAIYAPGTLIIKGLIAVAAALITHAIVTRSEKLRLPAFFAGAIGGELVMVFGYVLYEATVLGYGAGAVAGIVGNCVQGGFGVAAGVVLAQIIHKTKLLSKFEVYAI